MLVVVTPTESVALCALPPLIVNVQLPAATGVTVKVVLLAAAIVAMPLQLVVDGVKLPL